MSSSFSMTKTQWFFVALLVLAILAVYGGAIPLAVFLSLNPTPAAAEIVDEPEALALAPVTPAASGLLSTSTRSPTATRTRTPTPKPTATRTVTPAPSPTATAAPTRIRIAAPISRDTTAPALPAAVPAARSLAGLELNPRSMLVSGTTFFTSVCYGEGINLLQDQDYMAPADWSASEDRKCMFGFRINPANGLPTGRYQVHGGPDGQPRFFIIPPDAFAGDQQRLKQLSQMHLIVDPEQGCDALGAFGVTADGVNYQCSACDFLRSGGVCSAAGTGKSILLPINKNNILDPDATGGAFGFMSYPLVLFRKGFSVYFTGKSGYAPPRTYFESAVDTLLPGVNARTTAEMSERDVQEIAAQFDSTLTGIDPVSQLAPLEQEAAPVSPPEVRVSSKETGTIYFAAPAGAVLSSISWRVRPITNQGRKGFLETNLCLGLNGEESCFTGVEDFAHCAFFNPCRTGYSSLVPTGGEGYVATRYFPAGAAPIISDGRIAVKFRGPDIGTILEVEVKVRVRNADHSAAGKR